MKIVPPSCCLPSRRLVLALLCAGTAAAFSHAQLAPAPDAATLAKYDTNKDGRIDADEAAVQKADADRQAAARGEALVLSPFEVTADTRGYHASNTLSGTRLNTRLEDLASSITVITKQQLTDTAALDINDIFLYESNTEGLHQYTDFVQDRSFYNETTTLNPQSANRIRGVGTANMARGNFAASSSIPIDTYNIESVEISRGPNANIFGLGNAAGTVNILTLRANSDREISQVATRVDSYGGWRTNLDLNRPIIADKLALRLAAVRENKGFEREPSFEKITRMTGALLLQPFKKTSLRASVESYRNSYNRGNTTLPRDVYSEWQDSGMPVWNPTFGAAGGWRYLNDTTYTAVAANQETTLFPVGLYPNFNSFWARPSAYVANGVVERFEMARTSTTNAPGFNGARRYAETGGIYRRGGNAFGAPPLILYQVPSVSDRADYDYTSINFLAPNFGRDEAEISQIELEQTFLSSARQQLALQVGFYRENISRFDHSFLSRTDGATPLVSVDINEFYIDGTPNPYFLQPYIFATEPRVKFSDELNDNYRGTLAYQLDLTQNKGWTKWLGLHRFAAYAEERQLDTRRLDAREVIASDHSWITGNNALSIPNRGAEYHMGVRYYVGGPVTDAGPVIDYAPTAPGNVPGSVPFIWYGNNSSVPTIDTVDFESVIFSGSTLQRKISTQGITWQGFLWNDRIIPTLGWREDKQRERQSRSLNSNPTSDTTTIDPVTRRHDLSFVEEFPNPWVENSGRTKTKGVVVKPLSWLSLHYNESDSFVPEPIRYNIHLEQLSNPTGTGKDYGFSVNLFDGKLIAKLNKYETVELNSRSGSTGGAFAQRTFRFFFDPNTELTYNTTTSTFGNGLDPFDLEQVGAQWFLAQNPGLTPEQAQVMAVDTYLKPFGFDQAYMDRVRELGGGSFAEVNTVTSKGLELELNYNPTRYWTLKLTAARQQAIDTELSNNANRFFDQNLDALKAITDPTNGNNWWTTFLNSSSTGSPETWFFTNILTTLTQASANAGKPRPQTREWRFAATTNFRLAGISDNKWLKNMAVGGALRWEDKATLGYYGAAPLANGAVVEYDINRPIYDPARIYVDLLASYDMKLYNDKIKARVQLNVRNAFEGGRLQPFVYNPDGQPWNYRIIDPRQFILSVTFDL